MIFSTKKKSTVDFNFHFKFEKKGCYKFARIILFYILVFQYNLKKKIKYSAYKSINFTTKKKPKQWNLNVKILFQNL
jgi:hypothetical protein